MSVTEWWSNFTRSPGSRLKRRTPARTMQRERERERERERILDEEMTKLEGFQLKSELGAVSRRFGDV